MTNPAPDQSFNVDRGYGRERRPQGYGLVVIVAIGGFPFPSDAIHPARKPDAPTRVISDWSRSAKVAGRVPLLLP
jgi:hypothetical protein